MLKKLIRKLKEDRLTTGLVIGLIVVLLIGGVFLYNRLTQKQIPENLEEVSLQFDPEGVYARLLPRRDGNAIILNLYRIGDYDKISYELAYQADGVEEGSEAIKVDRGAQGTINNEDKNEFSQEILFGTCSKGDTFSTLHCVFDVNVENGNLTLKIQKDNKLYVMNTTWHFQKPDAALGTLTSGDGHFIYKTDGGDTEAMRQELSLTGFSTINELSGAPKIESNKIFVGKVYALNVPTARTLPKGELTIELADTPPVSAKIAFFNEKDNRWDLLETKINGSSLSTSAPGAGIYSVLSDK